MTGFITPDWGQLLDAWCKDLETDGRAASTIDGYRRHLDRLATDMMDRSPWSLTGHQLAEWVTGHRYRDRRQLNLGGKRGQGKPTT